MMTEMLSYGFMQRALVAGAVTGVLCALVGVFVVHKGLSFMGAGISHAAFGGVALGFWLGVNPVAASVVFCLGVGWAIGWISLYSQVREDTAVGIFFASTMALGVFLLGLMGQVQVDLMGYLFGSILSVTLEDLWIILTLALVVGGSLFFWGKELLFIIFDPEGAALSGLPSDRLYFLLITLVTFTVVISMKVVGIVLISALLITPAAAASQLSDRFGRILWLAAFIGLAATLSGLALSYWWNTASGATIVLLLTGIFGLTSLTARLRR
ncbi:MAG: metal ABC transporter permease [Deltaproteobacteria bacterium]|nr:metal ABC transporter permease [Deltaproteobacteria bacterium]